MRSQVILRQRKVTTKSSISVWERSSIPYLEGTSEEISWANSIRRTTLRKLDELAGELTEYYRRVPPKFGKAFTSALADVLHEIAVEQTEASWWIDNRLRVGATGSFYNMVGLEPLHRLLPDYTAVFNDVTMAYGITEYGADASDETTTNQSRVETTVVQGVVCARIKGRKGWISLE